LHSAGRNPAARAWETRWRERSPRTAPRPLPADGRLVAPRRRAVGGAGAQARHEIALEVTPGGFGTPEFEFGAARQRVRVEGVELVREVDGDERRAPLTTLAAASSLLGDLLPADPEPGEERLGVDPAAAAALAGWYRFGEEVLLALAATAAPADEASAPTLWPEHFDVAIELGAEDSGERATFGFSPGRRPGLRRASRRG
jgi:hypothetical protein